MATKSDTGSELRLDLRGFVEEHPYGWEHGEWLDLLASLRDRGHEVGDAAAIGRMLERERLAAVLARIPRVGPQRVQSIVERYGSLSGLREADVEDLTQATRIPRLLAERIKESV
jgi:excinuclease ABC subunit C